MNIIQYANDIELGRIIVLTVCKKLQKQGYNAYITTTKVKGCGVVVVSNKQMDKMFHLFNNTLAWWYGLKAIKPSKEIQISHFKLDAKGEYFPMQSKGIEKTEFYQLVDMVYDYVLDHVM